MRSYLHNYVNTTIHFSTQNDYKAFHYHGAFDWQINLHTCLILNNDDYEITDAYADLIRHK